MAANRPRHERLAALDKLAKMYLTGRSQVEMAKALNVSDRTIRHDLKRLQRIWLQNHSNDVQAGKIRELHRIDHLERTYWMAWRQTKAGKRREGQSGNPAFLAGVQWCIEQRCKILGLEAPRRQELEGSARLLIREVVEVTDDTSGAYRPGENAYEANGDRPPRRS
jgi:hypothetical protein